jgi:hypothetical protein
MKECVDTKKHSTCQRKVWNGDRSKKLCNYGGSFQSCFYKPDFIRFKDISDDTIMYSGDIKSTGDFRTKTEWITEFGLGGFKTEYGDMWHTAIVKTVKIDLDDLLERTEEDEEVYDGWYLDVRDAKKDLVVEAGFKRLNDILNKYPTYTEDLIVVFN